MRLKHGFFFKIVICMTVLSACACRAGASVWNEEDYAKYDFKSFAGLGIAQKRIDMAEIDYPLLDAAIFYETNRERAKAGMSQFEYSPALEKAAHDHSNDMVRLGFFSHTSPVKGKQTFVMRLARAGVPGGTSGENIAESFGLEYEAGRSVYTPDTNGGYFSYSPKGKPILCHTYIGFAGTVVKQWMESPGHRANILNAKFKYLGTGAAHFINKSFFGMDEFRCTQNFSDIKGAS
jgi:uncharacterized protein YkwD